MGSRAKKTGAVPKRRRGGRAMLVLGLLGLGAAAAKALRESSTPAPTAPAPRATAPAPTPTPPPAAPALDAEEEAIERLETESPAVPDVEPPAPEAEPPAPEAEAAASDIEPVEMTPAVEPTPATEDLHDIVEEPWAEDELAPVTEPPADSLTSFFDEVMTDTAERKLRNGQ